MRWLGYTLAAVFVVLAAIWGVVRLAPRWQARHLTPVMALYLRAAAAGDSVALTRVSTSPVPVRWALLVHREVPAFVEQAAARVRPEGVRFNGDTAIVYFRLRKSVPDPKCVYRPLDGVWGRFLRGADSAWRILSAAVDIC